MRHLLSLIAGVLVAPLAWILLAMGQAGTAATVSGWTADNAFDTTDLIKPAAYLVAAGLVLGLVATLRISPLGALVAGLAYLALNVGLFIDPFAMADAVPNHHKAFGESIPLRTPMLNGTLLAAGVLLFIAVFSAKRWRGWPVPAAGEPAATGQASAADEPTVVEPTVVEAPSLGEQPTAVIPPPREGPQVPQPPRAAPLPQPPPAQEIPLARDIAQARDADAETVAQPAATAPTSNAIPPPPTGPYTGSGTDESPSSPWAAPPRPADRD